MSLLLTSLGTARYTAVRYYLDTNRDRGHETAFAPVATAALVGRVDSVKVLLTDKAREVNWAALDRELTSLGLAPVAVPIPDGKTEDEIWEIFATIVNSVESTEDVVLDVTFSFRHLPFVFFASLTYLTALKETGIRGIYYGAYEARDAHGAPIFDLKPLLTLADWYYSVRTFVETGSSKLLSRALKVERGRLFRSRGPVPGLDRLEKALGELGESLPAGLPLEAGIAAARAVEAMDDVRGGVPTTTIARTVFERLESLLRDIALGAELEKGQVKCELKEIERQLRLVEKYLEWGQGDRALLLLREWIINRCLLALGPGRSDWLDYHAARHPQEQALNALKRRHTKGLAASSPGQSGLVSLWSSVAELRNSLAHTGFRPEVARLPVQKLRSQFEQCRERVHVDDVWRIDRPGAQGTMLLTALGLSPGVLFTALSTVRPDSALIITSSEAEPAVAEASRRAGWKSSAARIYRVGAPYECFDEVDAIVRWARPHALGASELVANLTGGTTAMQYLVERIAEDATRFGVPVRRIALIDRRDLELQRREPYVCGDVVPLASTAADRPNGEPAEPDD